VGKAIVLTVILASATAACGSAASDAPRGPDLDASARTPDAAPAMDAATSPDGDLDAGDAANDAIATPCSWSMTGLYGGCTVEVGFGHGQLGILLSGGNSAVGAFSFSAQLGTTAAFGPRTWTYAGVPIAGAQLQEGNLILSMLKDNGAGHGDFTLTISAVGPETMVVGGDLWTMPHGALTVQLLYSPPTQDAGTTVTASF